MVRRAGDLVTQADPRANRFEQLDQQLAVGIHILHHQQAVGAAIRGVVARLDPDHALWPAIFRGRIAQFR